MAHEITTTDGVVLHKHAAWHGLGTVVEDAPTPQEALKLADLDWEVIRKPLYVSGDSTFSAIPNHVANVRSDLPDGQNVLGVVSSKFTVIQNKDVAEFCAEIVDIAEGDQHCIETAGSLNGGKKVWFLIKGSSLDVFGDEIAPYLMAVNGHDGTAPLRIIPTTVRVVCANTLQAAVRHEKKSKILSHSVKHTVNMMERLHQAKVAIKFYKEGIDKEVESFRELAQHRAKVEDYQQFFLDCYTADFGDFPQNPQNKVEQNQYDRAGAAYQQFSERFDRERSTSGDNWWTAFNAYSGYVQHDRKVSKLTNRAESNLAGLNQNRTQDALRRAFSMIS